MAQSRAKSSLRSSFLNLFEAAFNALSADAASRPNERVIRQTWTEHSSTLDPGPHLVVDPRADSFDFTRATIADAVRVVRTRAPARDRARSGDNNLPGDHDLVGSRLQPIVLPNLPNAGRETRQMRR